MLSAVQVQTLPKPGLDHRPDVKKTNKQKKKWKLSSRCWTYWGLDVDVNLLGSPLLVVGISVAAYNLDLKLNKSLLK